MNAISENEEFLTTQIITYLENKRSLIGNIQKGERVFYTHQNALLIDTYRSLIDEVVPREELKNFFLAPLITQALAALGLRQRMRFPELQEKLSSHNRCSVILIQSLRFFKKTL